MKVTCIYHSKDLDGWMSAAIVKLVYPEATLIGWNYGEPVPDLSYDIPTILFMCDVSFPVENMRQLQGMTQLVWIDHHQRAITEIESQVPNIIGFRDSKFAACELTWMYFFLKEDKIPEIVRLLGRYDCFGHKQVWKAVIGYEGLYEVSNHGNVRSLDRIIVENNTGKERLIKGVSLCIANSKRGYRIVVLCKNGTEKTRNVHQLVAESFIPNPENKPCINHKDFNRLNNYVENLEWCTYAENNLHSIENGKRGKIVIQFTKDGEFVQQFDSIKIAETCTGIPSQNIGKVCKGEREFAGNYSWEYGVDKDVFPQFVPQDEELKVLEFQYGARQIISNPDEALSYLKDYLSWSPGHENVLIQQIWKSGKAIYSYLCTEAKQKYALRTDILLIENNDLPVRIFAAINSERFNPSNFKIDYHKDGYDGIASYFYNGKDWEFSLYNENGNVDCSAIAKRQGGGGHRGASGFRVQDITAFLSGHVILKKTLIALGGLCKTYNIMKRIILFLMLAAFTLTGSAQFGNIIKPVDQVLQVQTVRGVVPVNVYKKELQTYKDKALGDLLKDVVLRLNVGVTTTQSWYDKEAKQIKNELFNGIGFGLGAQHYTLQTDGSLFNDYGANLLLLVSEGQGLGAGLFVNVNMFQLGTHYSFDAKRMYIDTGITLKF